MGATPNSSERFRIFVPVSAYKKSGSGATERRIGGLISTESEDLDGEVILQDGLDFSTFLDKGYFNDNHSPKMADSLGYPTTVQIVEKGQIMPNGRVAPARGTWAEGYLFPDYEPADKIWNLVNSMDKAGGSRNLGFSIEGEVLRRQGPNGKTVARARVDHTAITHCPKNGDTGVSQLVKSLANGVWQEPVGGAPPIPPNSDIDEIERELITRAATVGNTSDSPGNLGVTVPESLDDDLHIEKSDRVLSHAEAISWVLRRIPGLSRDRAEEFVSITSVAKSRNLL